MKQSGGTRRDRDDDRRGGRRSTFVYQERDPAKIKERAAQSGRKFDSIFVSNVDTWRPKNGDNEIRFLPPTWDGAEHFGFDIYVHRYVGPDDSTYLCLDKMKGKTCPICLAAKEARDNGDAEEAKALSPTKQVATYILDRNEGDSNPLIYVMSWTMDKEIATLATDKKTGKTLVLDHDDEGYDVTFNRSGVGMRTRYSAIQIARSPSPVDEDQKVQDRVMEHVLANPIPDLLHFYDAAHLEKVISGTHAEKDDLDKDKNGKERGSGRGRDEDEEERRPTRRARDEEEEERPRRRRDRDEEEEEPRSARRAKDEEEEEEPPRRRKREDDEDTEDRPRGRTARKVSDEEEEEEPPRERVRSSARRDKDEPKDEPKDEEEEEEDTGRRSARRRR